MELSYITQLQFWLLSTFQSQHLAIVLHFNYHFLANTKQFHFALQLKSNILRRKIEV